MSKVADAIARTTSSLLAKQRYDPKGLLNPGKDDHLPAVGGRSPDENLDSGLANFAYLNWKQVEALPRDSTLLVLPTAAIEQHGHHLPLATDTLINHLLLGHALAKLPADLPVYALPPICYGKSNEHIGFPGTLSVTRRDFHGSGARSRREPVARRIQEALRCTTRMAETRRWST